MDTLLVKISNLLGGNIAPDHLKLVFSIISTYPCAVIFKRIQHKQYKHAFSILYTLCIMLGLLKMYQGFLHIITISLSSYLLLKYYPKASWINFAVVMISMSICHIGRQMGGREGDTELDYSGPLMIITIKLCSYGFNIADHDCDHLTPHTQQMKIDHYPTLLQYFGWLFYFAGFLAGPTCEYMDYIRLTEEKRIAPSGEWKPALKTLAKTGVFILGLVYFSPTFNFFQTLTPEWSKRSFLSKIYFIQASAILTRFKYYCIWNLSEGACILSGFGFNGYDKDGKPLWNKLTNVNVLSCEFAQSFKTLTENWNIGANYWLRHYVYLRLNSPGSGMATIKTYAVSSLWHGFHPGYYLFFILASVLQVLARRVRRTVRPLFLTVDGKPIPYWKTVYDVSTWAVSWFLINMLAPCFDLLHVPKIMYLWQQVYYCHFIVVAVGALLFYTLQPWLMSIQKKRLTKQE